MSVADKMLKEIVTLAKKVARQEHETGGLWDKNQQLEDERDNLAAEIETLRQQLDAAKRDASDEFTERQVLTVEQQQDAAAWQQQVDSANAELSYLRARLDEERSVSAGVREKLTAAEAAVTLQRAGIERLQAFVGMVRELLATPLAQISYDDMSVVRAELAALDDEPTQVAKPEDGK